MLIAWVYTIALAFIHFIAGRLVFLQNIPRSIWLSIAGGASISYIFLHLLPELGAYQGTFNEAIEGNWWSGKYVYGLALIGLIIFYGLERLVKKKKSSTDKAVHNQVFWLHISTYFIYNFIVGYLLLAESSESMKEATLFFVAMAFHFIVNDFSLLQDHQEKYKHQGRWLISLAIILGGAVASLMTVSEHLLIVLFGLISGTVILNVLKEELPEERQSRYWAFLTGAVSYGLLLILIQDQ